MEYRFSEIAKDWGLTKDTICRGQNRAGAPHRRDEYGNIWIVGPGKGSETGGERGVKRQIGTLFSMPIPQKSVVGIVDKDLKPSGFCTANENAENVLKFIVNIEIQWLCVGVLAGSLTQRDKLKPNRPHNGISF